MPLGLNYEIITAMLGFNPVRHAGKITGLAAYGKENPDCRNALDAFFDSIWKRRGNHTRPNYDDYMRTGPEGYEKLHALRKTRFEAFSREDIAYYIQDRTERQALAMIARFREQNPDLEDIALSGGVFANVKLNQHVKALGFRNIFIQPAMSDAGICFGAALLEAARQNGGRLEPFRLRDVFLGPEFSREEMAAAIKRAGLRGQSFNDEPELADTVARLIADKKVVAHFHGRMEYGPRALGNRSILYSAGDPSVNQWLNHQLRRTEFMPFAPAILWGHEAEFFEDTAGAEHTAEFMTITFNCKERAGREIPAAVHIDNTARPQIVHPERNPRFHAILSAYHRIAGIPAMINTSYNMHEEPIVATPDDAIRSFLQGHLDVLVLGNTILFQES
jgi:carbamoyltransferase